MNQIERSGPNGHNRIKWEQGGPKRIEYDQSEPHRTEKDSVPMWTKKDLRGSKRTE